MTFDDFIPDCPKRAQIIKDAHPRVHIIRIEAIQLRINERVDDNNNETLNDDYKRGLIRRLKYVYEDFVDPTVTIPGRYKSSQIQMLSHKTLKMGFIIHSANNTLELKAAIPIAAECLDILKRVDKGESK